MCFVFTEIEHIGKVHVSGAHHMLELLGKSVKEFCKQQQGNSSGEYAAM